MSEEISSVKLAFKAKTNERLTQKPNQWAGEDSAEVVLSCLTAITDGDGKPLVLTDEETDIVTVCSAPTHDVQMRVIRRIVAKRGVEPAQADVDLIKKVVSAPTFKLELVKAGKIKDKNAGRLNDLLG